MIVHQRKSNTSLSKIYFWTATIHNWLPLLATEKNKQIIIDTLKYPHWRKCSAVGRPLVSINSSGL
jgi:hypothetical protein